MTSEEFRDRISKSDHLLDTILNSPFVPVTGDPHELDRMAKERMAH
jgi:hypothetical protein